MDSMDIDGDFSPFSFELQIDDEITFKIPHSSQESVSTTKTEYNGYSPINNENIHSNISRYSVNPLSISKTQSVTKTISKNSRKSMAYMNNSHTNNSKLQQDTFINQPLTYSSDMVFDNVFNSPTLGEDITAPSMFDKDMQVTTTPFIHHGNPDTEWEFSPVNMREYNDMSRLASDANHANNIEISSSQQQISTDSDTRLRRKSLKAKGSPQAIVSLLEKFDDEFELSAHQAYNEKHSDELFLQSLAECNSPHEILYNAVPIDANSSCTTPSKRDVELDYECIYPTATVGQSPKSMSRKSLVQMAAPGTIALTSDASDTLNIEGLHPIAMSTDICISNAEAAANEEAVLVEQQADRDDRTSPTINVERLSEELNYISAFADESISNHVNKPLPSSSICTSLVDQCIQTEEDGCLEKEFESKHLKETIAMLREELIKKDTKIETLESQSSLNLQIITELRDQFKQEKEEASLSRIQCRTLSHHIQQLEIDLAASHSSHASELANIKHLHALDVKAIKEEIGSRAESEIASHKDRFEKELRSSLNKADIAENAVEELKRLIVLKEREFAELLDSHVKEAKRQVYEKAKQQFDQGNEQFLKLRKQLKATEESLLAATKSIEEKDKQLLSASSTLSQLTASSSFTLETIKDIASALFLPSTLIKSVPVNPQPSQLSALKTAIVHAIEESSKFTAEVVAQREQVKSVIGTLESALGHKEQALQGMSLELRGAIDRANIAEALLTTARVDISTLSRNLEQVTSVYQENKEALEHISKQRQDLENKCVRLKKMNEDLVCMIETKLQGSAM